MSQPGMSGKMFLTIYVALQTEKTLRVAVLWREAGFCQIPRRLVAAGYRSFRDFQFHKKSAELGRRGHSDTRIAGLVLPSARELLRRTRGDVAIAKQLQESLQLEVIRTMLGNNVSLLDGTDSCLSGNE